jgi:DNA invertase Pin-like site-specific DNA recombinase
MAKSEVWAYGRVSSSGQCLDRQIDKFKEMGIDDRHIITEKKSGKNIEDRAAYIALRDQMLRSGDTLVICSIDRLGRNKDQIKKELEHYKQEGIRVKILDIPTTLIDFPAGQEWVCDMVNNILIEVLGSIAEDERNRIKSRQAQGIAAAKKKGVVKFGRPRAEKPDNWDEVITKWKAGEITAVKAMELTGTTRSTFYKLAKE